MNLLIVDDIATNRKLLRITLEGEGHTTLEAADGVEALQILEREKVDAVISDILMPKMDGFRLCREIRKSESLRNLPFVIYTSTYTSPDDVKLARTIGADQYLTKPASTTDMLEALRAAAKSRSRTLRSVEHPAVLGETYVLEQYSKALVHKLEEKNAELKQSVDALQRAHDRIVELNEGLEKRVAERTAEAESARLNAEKANRAKSDFLCSMSHELRTPLNAILGFTQLMESAIPGPSASQTKNIAQILQAGWYLLKLVNEVLDLAAIESGKLSMSKEPMSLAELMSECRSMMESQAQQRGIHITFPEIGNPVFVSADRIRLKQIILNLISNAIKYNHEQGTVVVDCAEIEPDRVRISVRDTGAGLPPENLAQLFQPFNRLGQEAGSVAGTGIGLVVCKQLAELMGGVIGVESKVGVGSVFWCELPLAAPPQLAVRNGDSDTMRRPEALADAPKGTLLYVEDNPANLELVEQLVGRFPDLRLATAINGTLGIDLARATLPTVILMDINLPGISGIKALKILREDPATAHIPVIALSANAMPSDIALGLEAGFYRYLTKPIRIKALMDVLNEALEFAEVNRLVSAQEAEQLV